MLHVFAGLAGVALLVGLHGCDDPGRAKGHSNAPARTKISSAGQASPDANRASRSASVARIPASQRAEGEASRASSRPGGAHGEGLTVLLSGIEGGALSMVLAKQAIIDAGVPGEVRVLEWGMPLGGLNNLVEYDRNRHVARKLVQELVEYRRMRPRGPINIVGYSGGGGMAVMLAEALPESVHVRSVLIVQGAVSRDYDLTRVLQHVDGRVVNFYCPSDSVVLGMGTQVWGNMDRGKGPAAGKDGFLLDLAVPNPALRAKVVQVAWTQEMMRSGHFGGHVECLGYQWNRDFVAPWLKPRSRKSAAVP